MTQNSLACVYQVGDRAENVRHAIEYCRAVLRVYTETDFPEEWHRTQDNLRRVQARQQGKSQ